MLNTKIIFALLTLVTVLFQFTVTACSVNIIHSDRNTGRGFVHFSPSGINIVSSDRRHRYFNVHQNSLSGGKPIQNDVTSSTMSSLLTNATSDQNSLLNLINTRNVNQEVPIINGDALI
ncbi:uncharacterized protein LOC129607501 [Condylostylus longicornis]|uniref:uncharacterized protein LOC129607501 n=1 Tax=Condylostylus longicornis TaxID=2530218 RepID=UPI00244E4893|nr:uncharacterized protein LOC129607501 [Condylostylus longicornis]